jgi:transposase
MRFYNRPHRHYCGIDLHVKTMYVCILDGTGQVVVHRNMKATPEACLEVVAAYRADLVVAAECMFTWYWLADVCAAEGITFVLGHALAMKAIHGGKAKNDKLDSFKIATLLRGGLLPQAYVYPAAMRSTRDLLRRRLHLVRKRGQLLAHIQNTRAQYNLPEFERRLAYPANRDGVPDCFADPSVRKSIEVDLALLERYDGLITDLELTFVRTAKEHDADAFHRLRSVPGIGKVLALTILYEIHDITRFDRVQEFASYAAAGQGAETVRWQAARHEWRQDGQRPFKVGLFGSRHPLSAPRDGREEIPHEARAEARQGEGAVDPRPQDRTGGLLHPGATHRLFAREVHGGVAGSRVDQPHV